MTASHQGEPVARPRPPSVPPEPQRASLEAASGEPALTLASARLERVSTALFASAAALGLIVLLGWALDVRLGLDPWLTNTKPNTALALLLLGTSLWLERSSGTGRELRQAGALVAIVVVSLLSLLSLFETLRELDFGIDALLLPQEPRALRTSARMSPVSAANLCLLSAAAIMVSTRERAAAIALAALPLFLSLSALVGYAYGAEPRLHALSLPPMVGVSALGVTLLAAGIIATQLLPETALLLTGTDTSSLATRRLLLGLVSIPIALGSLELLLRRLAVYELEFGIALLVVANILLLVSLALWYTHATQRAQRRQSQLERDLAHKEALLDADARMRSERARADLALQRSEEKFRTLAVHAPVGIFEADPDGACTFVNRKWTELTEVTLQDALGLGWTRVIHPDDRERVSSSWAEATRLGEPLDTEFRYLAPSGKVSWVQGAAVPVRDDKGAFSGYLGTMVDVTERRHAMDALAKSERNFRSLVERAPFGVVVFRSNLIVYANRAYLQMLGYGDASELIGKPLLDTLVHVSAHSAVLARMKELDKSTEMAPMTITCLRKDGGEVVMEGTGSRIAFDGRNATVAVARDVTEQQRVEQVRIHAERALRESLREKEVLLKEIHHRVKNNLQVIVSLINLQSSKLTDPATHTAFAETRARVHAIALLHERLYRSKNIGRIDMREYLHGLANDLCSTAERRDIVMQVTAEEVYWEMDSAVPIGLIVNELVTNSFKHGFPPDRRSSGRIHIDLTRHGRECIVTVSDNGVGYPGTFDIDNHDSLGLLLITSLSRQLGGDVTFDTREGACAVVTFPDPSRDVARAGDLKQA